MMLRRKPTRIELGIEDMEEWNSQKKALENQKKRLAQTKGNEPPNLEANTPDTKYMRSTIYERVGLGAPTRMHSNSPR